jgi:hypothetical protein
MSGNTAAPSAPPQKLTEAQWAKVEIGLHSLAKHGNAWGMGITRQIEGKSTEERRRIILGAVGQMWEAMMCLQLAMNL